MMIVLAFFMSCENKAPRIEDVICGGNFRYWYKQGVPNRYHYFDVNGRKENFCVSRSGEFMEILMPDFEMSTTWKPLNDSTIIMYHDIEYHVKIIDKETISTNFVMYYPTNNPKFAISINSPNISLPSSGYKYPINQNVIKIISNNLYKYEK